MPISTILDIWLDLFKVILLESYATGSTPNAILGASEAVS